MKYFITYGITPSGDRKIIAGPNPDYSGQSKSIKELVSTDCGFDKLRLVDLTRGTVKSRPVKPAESAPAKKKTTKKDQ